MSRAMEVKWHIPAQHQNLKEDILHRVKECPIYAQATEVIINNGACRIRLKTGTKTESFAPYFRVTFKNQGGTLAKVYLIYDETKFIGYKDRYCASHLPETEKHFGRRRRLFLFGLICYPATWLVHQSEAAMKICFQSSVPPLQHQQLCRLVQAHKQRNPRAAHAGRVVIAPLSDAGAATQRFACIFTQGPAAASLLLIELPRET